MSTTYDPFKDRTGPFKKSLPTNVQPVAMMAGAGSPEGVIPANVGTLYQDVDTNALYQKQLGTGKIGWTLTGVVPTSISGGGVGNTQVFSGTSTDPNGVITATAPAIYYSTVDGSQWVKTSAGSSNTGWEKIL